MLNTSKVYGEKARTRTWGLCIVAMCVTAVLVSACTAGGRPSTNSNDDEEWGGTGGSGGSGGSSSSGSMGGNGGSMGCTCDGLACGQNACGQSCGQCAANSTCVSGQCVCTPACAGKNCGNDGCGSTCGSCGAQEMCDAGTCVPTPPPPKPDLTVDYFYIDDHALAAGQKSDIHFGVKNQGSVNVTFGFQIVVALSANNILGDADDVMVWSWAYPYIVSANDESLWQSPVTIPAGLFNGDYYIGMFMDATNTISESDEGNNVLFDAKKFKILGNPNLDLTPSDPVAGQVSVFPGQMANYTFTMQNLGANAVGSYKVGLYYSTDATLTTGDTLICEHTDANGLVALGSETIQVTCPVPSVDGQHRFGVIVDPGLIIKETNEANNVAVSSQIIDITILDTDLQIGQVATNDSTVDTGQQVMLSATVTNTGTSAAPPFKVAFYYSKDSTITTGDIEICEVNPNQSLPPNQPLDVQATCTIPLIASNQYWLGAIVDSQNEVPETNEGNNTATNASKNDVLAPNMDIDHYQHYQTDGFVKPGDSVTFSLRVDNWESAQVPISEASMYYSLDGSLGGGDDFICQALLDPLPPFSATTFVFTCTVPQIAAAHYYLCVSLDPANKIPETNETNNVACSSFAEVWVQ